MALNVRKTSMLVISGASLLYAFLALELGLNMLEGQMYNWQYRTLDWFLGPGYTEPGLVHYQQLSAGSSLAKLVANHAVFNGIALLLAALQIMRPVFKISVRGHRIIGILYSVFLFAGISFSSIYLWSSAPAEVYSGEIFHYALWMLTLSTVFTYFVGMYYLLRGKLLKHKLWMQYHFSWMFSAPLLRALWVFTGAVGGGSHVANNIASVTLSPLLLSGGMAVAFYLKLGNSGYNETEPFRYAKSYMLIAWLGLALLLSVDMDLETFQWVPLTAIFCVIAITFNLYLYWRAFRKKQGARLRLAALYLRFFAISPVLVWILIPSHRSYFASEEQVLMGAILSILGIGMSLCFFRASFLKKLDLSSVPGPLRRAQFSSLEKA